MDTMSRSSTPGVSIQPSLSSSSITSSASNATSTLGSLAAPSLGVSPGSPSASPGTSESSATPTQTPTQPQRPGLRIDVDSLPRFPLHHPSRFRSNSALPSLQREQSPSSQSSVFDTASSRQQTEDARKGVNGVPSPGEGTKYYEPASHGVRSLARGEPPPPPPKSANRPRASTSPDQPPTSAATENSLSTSITPKPTKMNHSEIAAEDITMRMIKEALEKSEDDGDTLDLSRKEIEKIDNEAVEMFKSGVGKGGKGVWRLALSYNFLRDWAVVDSFAKLSRLRYLNLKGNHFTQFPHAITQMPALEILDFSKNRITSFPETPGHLVQLKVLSLTSNRIRSLPSYMVDFAVLKVFKVDQNPVEWPPADVLGPLCHNAPTKGKASIGPGGKKRTKEEDLRPWIDGMKSWISQRVAEGVVGRGEEEAYLGSEEEAFGATLFDTPAGGQHWPEEVESFSMIAPSSQETIRRTQPLRDGSPRTDIATQLFAQRSISATFSEDLLQSSSPGYSPRGNHSRDPSASSFTSPPSVSTEASPQSCDSPNLLPRLPLSTQGHSRGASYTPAKRNSQSSVTAKKSLPDLRQSHAKIIKDRRGDTGDGMAELGMGVPGLSIGEPNVSAGMEEDQVIRGSNRQESIDRFPSVGDLRRVLVEKNPSPETPLIDDSRNSYFRRLSTLPTSTISKTIPPFLLKFIDAIRGILFALSQLHSSLKQYLTFAVNERVAGIFRRVMEPAGGYMNKLINALDRFDSMSRRGTPPTQAVKVVFNATKESVAVFGKIVAVLKLQIPAMRGSDVRYTRTLLVNVYGAMAEVATSWKLMAGFSPEVRMLLFVDTASRGTIGGGQKMVPTGSFQGRTPISPIIERQESYSPQSAAAASPLRLDHNPLPQDASPTSVAERKRAQIAGLGGKRRHAGSYSGQDLERGMKMGSPLPRDGYEAGVDMGHGRDESGTIHLPLPEKDEAEDSELELPTFAGLASPQPAFGRGHHPSSSSGSSYAPPFSAASQRKLSVDVRPPTPASATLYDEDLLDVIETATDVAFTSWLKLSEEMGANSPQFSESSHVNSASISSASSQGFMQGESARMPSSPFTPLGSRVSSRRPSTVSPKHHAELVHYLSVAEQVTATLRESLMRLRANPASLPTSTLPDDAQQFIKVVVKVSEMVKAMSASHPFPASVRQTVGKLTQATRECAILIQVSSLRPGQVTPANVPSSARSMSLRSGNVFGYGGPASSTEDLGYAQSEGYYPPHQYSSSTSSSFDTTPQPIHPQGLRGLRLPTRQALLGRGRSANTSAPVVIPMPVPYVGGGRVGQQKEPPRSAQASQVAF